MQIIWILPNIILLAINTAGIPAIFYTISRAKHFFLWCNHSEKLNLRETWFNPDLEFHLIRLSFYFEKKNKENRFLVESNREKKNSTKVEFSLFPVYQKWRKNFRKNKILLYRIFLHPVSRACDTTRANFPPLSLSLAKKKNLDAKIKVLSYHLNSFETATSIPLWKNLWISFDPILPTPSKEKISPNYSEQTQTQNTKENI